jgi:hypothetical protein
MALDLASKLHVDIIMMNNDSMKLVEVVIPHHRLYMVENLLRLTRMRSAGRASLESQTTLSLEVRNIDLADTETDDLPDITDALIDITEQIDHSVKTATKNEKSSCSIPLNILAKGKRGKTPDLSFDESEIERLVNDISSLESRSQSQRREIIEPFSPPLLGQTEIDKVLDDLKTLDTQVNRANLSLQARPKIRRAKVSTNLRRLPVGITIF